MAIESPILPNALSAFSRTAQSLSFNASRSAGMAVESLISPNFHAAYDLIFASSSFSLFKYFVKSGLKSLKNSF